MMKYAPIATQVPGPAQLVAKAPPLQNMGLEDLLKFHPIGGLMSGGGMGIPGMIAGKLSGNDGGGGGFPLPFALQLLQGLG